jgi:acetylornithine deacetylase/succinyl-diaminopimelate desuccinylase-like protein
MSTAVSMHDHIDQQRLVAGCVALVDVPAPTGFERACAERAVELLVERGLNAELLLLDEHAADAWALIPARGPRAGSAPTVLLYSPIDTVTTGNVAEDIPQVAERIAGHLCAESVVTTDASGNTVIVGLGAQNPKGHAACVLEAAAVLASANELDGDVVIGIGAGGMPTDPLDRAGEKRLATGHGVGAAALLNELRRRDVFPAAAVIAKSGWFVQHEEVGLAWIDVVVQGTHTYVGARHRIPYRNAVADAARVVVALEDEFMDATRGGAGTLEPQAMVSSLVGGWDRMPAFLPASARLRCDIRVLPGETAAVGLARVGRVLEQLRAKDPDLDARAEITLDIAGSHTAIDHWICDSARKAWELTDGRPHESPTRQSGSTDANILRNAGVPTARIGLPKVHVNGAELGFAEGMNTVDTAAMTSLTELLLRTVAIAHTHPHRDAGS